LLAIPVCDAISHPVFLITAHSKIFFSGPETAADARSHFGIFAPQVWTLFPEGQVVNLYLWDYNDVAPAYFAAAQLALNKKVIYHCLVVVHSI